jgi:hypothetical protein
VAVDTLPSSEFGSEGLNSTWVGSGFRVLTVYTRDDDGFWVSYDTVPVRMSSLLAPAGLGNDHADLACKVVGK